MKIRYIFALLVVVGICPLRAQIISDFSSFTPSWYSPGWSSNVAHSGASSFAIGNFGNGQPLNDGGFGVWLGEMGLDWSGYTHIYLSGIAVAGVASNATTSFNFFLMDADSNMAIVFFDTADFATLAEVGKEIDWSGVDPTRITDWGIGTSISGTDNFAFTFDRAAFSPVPEPSISLLLLGGATAVLLRQRRKIRKLTSRISLDRGRINLRGMTLVELLVVMGLVGMLMAVTMPAVGSLNRGNAVARAAGEIPDLFSQARSYAMTHNTYVYVGLRVGNMNGDSAIWVGVVASRNGLAGTSDALTKDDLFPISKVLVFEAVSLDTDGASAVLTGSNALANGCRITDSKISFPADAIRPGLGFSEFDSVVRFSPAGAASLSVSERVIPSYVVMGFVPARGGTANAFGVQVDGPSGVARAVRPSL
ncbi:hypothetical protein DB345_00115 [Spartobacteria bacterium LR76]|nr:hypothetical protein DB345_00115 [Spartobacteria bacterium LR76]